MQMKHMWAWGFVLVAGVVWAVVGCNKSDDDGDDDGGGTVDDGTALIADHRHVDASVVPTEWITAAKQNLRIYYGHTSHGSQIISGMEAMADATFAMHTNNSVVDGSLSIQEESGDLGTGGDLTWRDTTVTQLGVEGQTRNVVVWSWCGGVSENNNAGIDAYLNAMNTLEAAYPSVKFVYMTGHLDGSGTSGTLHRMNERIRAYCRDHGKTLFDFADIERYDPDGNDYLSRGADDGCNYSGGNWATEWCAAHPGECSSCDCAHSQSLNCDRKARAFWWLLARMAGWDGE